MAYGQPVMKKRTNYFIPVLIGIFLLSAAAFIVIGNEMVMEKENKLDFWIFSEIEERATPFSIRIFRVVSFFGSIGFIIGAYVITTISLLYFKRKKAAVFVGSIGIGALLLLEGMKILYKRDRPDFPILEILKNYSFPSGHAFHAFVFFSVISLLAWNTKWPKKRKITISVFLFLFVMAIGFSRIILRYHYSSDVLAGFCLGSCCLSVFLLYRLAKMSKAANSKKATKV